MADKPKYLTVDQNFHARLDGNEIVVPLSVKTKLYRRILTAGDAVSQLFAVFDGLDLQKEADIVDEIPAVEAGEVAEKYFEAFNAFMGASLGESRGSSTS